MTKTNTNTNTTKLGTRIVLGTVGTCRPNKAEAIAQVIEDMDLMANGAVFVGSSAIASTVIEEVPELISIINFGGKDIVLEANQSTGLAIHSHKNIHTTLTKVMYDQCAGTLSRFGTTYYKEVFSQLLDDLDAKDKAIKNEEIARANKATIDKFHELAYSDMYAEAININNKLTNTSEETKMNLLEEAVLVSTATLIPTASTKEATKAKEATKEAPTATVAAGSNAEAILNSKKVGFFGRIKASFKAMKDSVVNSAKRIKSAFKKGGFVESVKETFAISKESLSTKGNEATCINYFMLLRRAFNVGIAMGLAIIFTAFVGGGSFTLMLSTGVVYGIMKYIICLFFNERFSAMTAMWESLVIGFLSPLTVIFGMIVSLSFL